MDQGVRSDWIYLVYYNRAADLQLLQTSTSRHGTRENMVLIRRLAILAALPHGISTLSPNDRIYTGDQTSNTITVIRPSDNTVLGTIALGSDRLGNALNPQNVGSVNAHGLGFSRDGKYIVSLSTLSNTVTVIRTANNKIVHTSYVDRGPHEAFFSPDGLAIWIGTRGVSSVSCIDAMNGTLLNRIYTGQGPSKVLFSPDGSTAYVNHIFEPILSVIDVPTQTVRYNISGLADKFSSDMMISPDGRSIWAAHKMTGQVSVIDLGARRVISVLETGPETNHPNFVVRNGLTYAYVTVASMNATRVYSQATPDSVPVFIQDIHMTGVQPHGLWPSADYTRMYVINEHTDTVDVIDTSRNDIVDTMRVGQEGQALIYVPNAVSNATEGMKNLGQQGLGLRAESRMVPVFGKTGDVPHNSSSAVVTVREVAGLEMFQVIGRQLVLNGTYTVSAVPKAAAGIRLPLATFKAATRARSGCGGAPQVLAFFKFFGVYDMSTVEVREGPL